MLKLDIPVLIIVLVFITNALLIGGITVYQWLINTGGYMAWQNINITITW